jgi:hypothetical protein
MFGVVAGGNVNIGFTRPDWAIQLGQTIPGEISIDRRFAEHVSGVAIQPASPRSRSHKAIAGRPTAES